MDSGAYDLALIRAVCEGRLGTRPSLLRPDLFDGLEQSVTEIVDYRERHGAWPRMGMLTHVLTDRETAHALKEVPESEISFAVDRASTLLRERALEAFYWDMGKTLPEGPVAWDRYEKELREALSVVSHAPPSYDFVDHFEERYAPEAESLHGMIRSPTALPAIDHATGGGLRSGELGLVMGPTGRGKTHMMVWMGTKALQAGHRVLCVSLELMKLPLARRFDRCLTGMSLEEIEADPEIFKIRWRETCSALSGSLRIVFSPRRTLKVADIEEMVRERLDVWQEPFVLTVDYGSILTPSQMDSPHKEVGTIHEDLSNLGQKYSLPVWTPYQANRQGEGSETGRLGLEHAGESYGAMQHADLVLVLEQSITDRMTNKMRIRIAKARDTAEGQQLVRPRWETSQLELLR